MNRARAGAAALLLALGAAGAAMAQPQAAAPRSPALQALLARSAALLAGGEAGAALQGYEAAANQEHALDIELGIVLSLMRSGEYRRALAFAAHTAQAHADRGEGPLLYARLLEAGGQPGVARRVLDAAEARPDGSARLTVARLAVDSLLGSTSPQRPVSGGVLVGAGRHALVGADAIGDTTALWVRDGRGRSVGARIEQRDAGTGLALLRLDEALGDAPAVQLSERDAFPGSPAHAVAGAPDGGWPRLHTGFVGRVDGARPGERALGIDLPAGPRGAPVFDASGRMIGIALGGGDGRDRLLPSSALRERFGERFGAAATNTTRAPLDAIYETALRVSVQVFLAAP